jgi:Domain of unknown function (DUF4411)
MPGALESLGPQGGVEATKQWEQSAAYFIDRNDVVDAFVKNAGLGFAIPYLHNGQMHDEPDFIVRLKGYQPLNLILETKGYDPIKDVKRQAAERCVVTAEVSKPRRVRANRHIPDVCDQLGVQWMDGFGLIRSLNFSTSWRAHL